MRGVRFSLPVALAIVAIAAGCGGKHGGSSNETGRVTVKLITPPSPSPDPFAGLSKTHVIVREGATIVFEMDFGSGVPITVQGLTAGLGRTVELQGFDSTPAIVSHGITLPFDFAEGQSITVPLYFARSKSFNVVHGTPTARVGAASAAFPDGTVLIAGGLSGSTGLDTAELYDPLTDLLATAGTMSTAHSFTQAVMLSTSEVLVAGGATTASGATAKADVFVRSGATGTWIAGVASMSTQRRDLAIARLSAAHALAAGGDMGNGNPLDTTEVFSWNGSTGSWTPGDVMSTVRMGAFALPVQDGKVVVGGGYKGGTSFFSKTTDIYDASGTQSGGNDLKFTAGYEGITRLDATTWLLTGGEADIVSPLFTAQTQTVRWTGNDITSTLTASLPSSHRRGGGARMSDGSVLVEGGDTGTRPFVTPVDESLFYDPGANTFTPSTATAGATTTFAAYPLADGTSVIVTDAGVLRYNP